MKRLMSALLMCVMAIVFCVPAFAVDTANVMLERRLKANYRTGFWEMIFLHTKPLAAVPSDMRAGRN